MAEKDKITGTLVPITALTSNHTKNDQGTFATALFFLDWLKKTGQNSWQLLPLHETQLEPSAHGIKYKVGKHVPCPYKSYGIGLDPRFLPTEYSEKIPSGEELEGFIKENKDWITDYAFFCALRDHFGTDDWRDWGEGLAEREKMEMDDWAQKLKKETDNYIVLQWRLQQAYSMLKEKAGRYGISLIGDLSFYVSLKSPCHITEQPFFVLT